MLKRTLVIGLLLTFGLVLMGAGPPTVHTVTFQTENGEGILFWFEADPVADQRELTVGPDYQPIEIPSDVLASLPSHVRDAFQGNFDSSLASSVNGCVVRAHVPYENSGDVKGRIDLSCIYVNVVETKLEGKLTMEHTFGSDLLDDYDSGWQSWLSHGHTLSGDCVQKTNSYKNWAKGSVKFATGGISTSVAWKFATITCSQIA